MPSENQTSHGRESVAGGRGADVVGSAQLAELGGLLLNRYIF